MSRVIKKQKKHICLINWRKRVATAKANGRFEDEDCRAAGNWNTCAVGEGKTKLNAGIRKTEFEGIYSDDEPKDKRLDTLGYNFYEYVTLNKFISASRCLDAIERRLNKLYVLV